MDLHIPVPGLAEDTEGKWGGTDPKSKGLLEFCALGISPLNLLLALTPTSKGCLERQAGPGGGGKLSAGFGVCV